MFPVYLYIFMGLTFWINSFLFSCVLIINFHRVHQGNRFNFKQQWTSVWACECFSAWISGFFFFCIQFLQSSVFVLFFLFYFFFFCVDILHSKYIYILIYLKINFFSLQSIHDEKYAFHFVYLNTISLVSFNYLRVFLSYVLIYL